jgi:5-hydroxyisourate hydrolase
MAGLTTHILDTAQGKPAGNVAVRLFSITENRDELAAAVTNSDGRTDTPLLEGDALTTGDYELEFDIGAYFLEQGLTASEPAFLGTVVIRVTLLAGQDYHVPLLVSPWSYSTYRGS